MEKGLFPREWVAIFLILGFMASLCAISSLSRISKQAVLQEVKSSLAANQKTIEVEFVGAVKKPGIYHFPPGIRMKEALRSVSLSKNADRKKVNLGKILYVSQKCIVPEQEGKKVDPRRKNAS